MDIWVRGKRANFRFLLSTLPLIICEIICRRSPALWHFFQKRLPKVPDPPVALLMLSMEDQQKRLCVPCPPGPRGR